MLRRRFLLPLLTSALAAVIHAAEPATAPAVPAATLNSSPAGRVGKLPPNPKIMIIPVNDRNTSKEGMIDEWQADFIARRLQTAERDTFDLVILEIETNGGYVDSCERINRSVSQCKVPVVAYVNGKALSGGAVLAMGTKAIYMSPGSQIGGAKAVSGMGPIDPAMRQKWDGRMKAMMKSLCDANNYPHAIAQGMVDSKIEVLETDDSKHRLIDDEEFSRLPDPKPKILHKWKGKDEILTVTSTEALSSGLAQGVVAPEQLETIFGASPNVIRMDITADEKVARFLSHWAWRALLILIAVVAIGVELIAGGHGVGLIVSAFCLGVFFWLQTLAFNAGLIEVSLFVLGAILLGVELFVLPGFGIAGIGAIMLIGISILLSFLPDGVSISTLWQGTGSGASESDLARLTEGMQWAAITGVLVVVALSVGIIKGISLPGLSRLALKTEMPSSIGEQVPSSLTSARTSMPDMESLVQETEAELSPIPGMSPLDALIGKTGIAETTLKPSGKVRVDGRTYDAMSESGFVDPGTPIVVSRLSSNNIMVKIV